MMEMARTAASTKATGSHAEIHPFITLSRETGAGATTYDLSDQLRFGVGASVVAASVVNSTPGSIRRPSPRSARV